MIMITIHNVELDWKAAVYRLRTVRPWANWRKHLCSLSGAIISHVSMKSARQSNRRVRKRSTRISFCERPACALDIQSTVIPPIDYCRFFEVRASWIGLCGNPQKL